MTYDTEKLFLSLLLYVVTKRYLALCHNLSRFLLRCSGIAAGIAVYEYEFIW